MKEIHLNIPLGAQHISLLEPVKFQFTTQNEKIIDVKSDVGFVHRGVERACTTKFEYKQIGYVVARICGLCAITHTLTYTASIEKLLNAQITRKAKYLRMLLVELDRIHSHMLCLAHVCESAGYEAGFMDMMASREPVMDLQETITGNRVQFDYIDIGGVNSDIDATVAKSITQTLLRLKVKIEQFIDEFQNITLVKKFRGIGILSKANAYSYNAIGPLARAAGMQTDVRRHLDYLPYKEVGFEIVTQNNGDIEARNSVRLLEILNSIKMCINIVEGLPEGDIKVKVGGKPDGEVITFLEAPRGELMYYIKASGAKKLDRVRIKTPTFASIPAMVATFKNQEYADAPAILASFDPCLSCTAK
jgi:ech hydrogenase subunit E